MAVSWITPVTDRTLADVARLKETGEPVPQNVLDKRAEARAFIRANEVTNG